MHRTVVSALALLLASQAAHAAIVSVTGACTQIGAPPSCLPFALTGPNAYAWDEQQPTASLSVPVDLTINPSNSTSPTPGTIGGIFNTHFIHFEDFSGVNAVGTVLFDAQIAAVAYSDVFLDLSDAPGGAFATLYPTTLPGRGINGLTFIGINGPLLTFDFRPIAGTADMEQVRVYTHPVPTPGSLALAALGGIVALRRRR